MIIITINDVSFNSDAIKVVQRVQTNGVYAVQFYIDIGDIGKLFEFEFSDLLSKDNKASKLAYDTMVNYIVHKRSGIIDIVKFMRSLSLLYREVLSSCHITCSDIDKIQELRRKTLKDYSKSLNKLIDNLL